MNADQYWLSAEAAFDKKDWGRAEALYGQALAANPAHVPSLISRSTTLTQLGRHREAHACIMAAWEQRPADTALRYGIAQRLRYFSEFAALEECLSSPALAVGAPPQILARCVVMLSSIGAHAAAVRLADQALSKASSDAACLYVRGNLHFFDGQLDEADLCYERAMRSDPGMFQAAWMQASLKAQTSDSNHVVRLRKQVSRAKPGGQGEVYLGYALHKELHDLGDYEGAWEALARANLAKRKQVEFSLEEAAAYLSGMKGLFTNEFLSTRSNVALPARPLFIVGMHRSGTTLLERILSGHSMIGDAGETSSIDALIQLGADYAAPGRTDPVLVERMRKMDFDEMARGYAGHVPWLSRGKPIFTEKLPSNFWNVGVILKAFPGARILHLIRDPMDTCFSNFRTFFAGVATYSYDQAELAGFYAIYRQMMDHWREIAPGAILDVDYHELVEHPELVAKRVAAYCGVDYEASMIDTSRSQGRVATASASTARQGIRRDRSSIWKRYQSQLLPLQQGLQQFYEAGIMASSDRTNS